MQVLTFQIGEYLAITLLGSAKGKIDRDRDEALHIQPCLGLALDIEIMHQLSCEAINHRD